MNQDYALRAFAADLRRERHIVWPDVRLKMLADAYEEAGRMKIADYLRQRLADVYLQDYDSGGFCVGCVARGGAPPLSAFGEADSELAHDLKLAMMEGT